MGQGERILMCEVMLRRRQADLGQGQICYFQHALDLLGNGHLAYDYWLCCPQGSAGTCRDLLDCNETDAVLIALQPPLSASAADGLPHHARTDWSVSLDWPATNGDVIQKQQCKAAVLVLEVPESMNALQHRALLRCPFCVPLHMTASCWSGCTYLCKYV